ncbi:MAG: hypothetical protein ACREL5_11020 [Gemmatimonadales bacterium]
MTFVALSISDWPTGAAASDLLAALLDVAPRAAVDPARQIAWLDARGLDAGAMIARARNTLNDLGIRTAGAAAAAVPIVAEIAAKQDFSLLTSHFSLAVLPLDVLGVSPTLLSLFDGVGVTCCGDLAKLARESVEVRFGREGLAAWRLARSDDPRPIFSARPRELPNASIDWSEFSTGDLEQLAFVLHSLLKTVCDALERDGLGARSLVVTLHLENRTVITQPVGAARSTAQRTTWLRLVRRALEKITLPDHVTGVAVQVESIGAPAVRQGDLFDLGFATAHAAESTVGQILDLQGDAVVVAERSGHHLPERRVRWVADAHPVLAARPSPAQHTPALQPVLLPVPREVAVITRTRRGAPVPVRYTDNGAPFPLRESLGPNRLSDDGDDSFARDYHQAVRNDGVVVLLYREIESERWYLSGWWD